MKYLKLFVRLYQFVFFLALVTLLLPLFWLINYDTLADFVIKKSSYVLMCAIIPILIMTSIFGILDTLMPVVILTFADIILDFTFNFNGETIVKENN